MVSESELPPQPASRPSGGFQPYPNFADPAEPSLTDPNVADPTPGYFRPDPSQALTAVPRLTKKQWRQVWRHVKRGQDPAVAVKLVVTGSAGSVTSPTTDAPFGRHPKTGEPLSDKYKWLAAFLQLFLGVIGAGRFYIGDARTGFISIGALIVSILATVYLGAWFLFLVLGLWCLADFMMILSGHVTDSDGRKLR